MSQHVLDVHALVRIHIRDQMPHGVIGVGIALLDDVCSRSLALAADTEDHSAGSIFDLVLIGVEGGVVYIHDCAHVGGRRRGRSAAGVPCSPAVGGLGSSGGEKPQQ